MIVNRRIVIDLLAGGRYDTAHVVQGDTYSRAVELELRQGNMAWEIPEGVSVVVEYIKADDTRGLYSTLPDGAQAWHADGNILTLMLAPQMLTAKGNVVTQVRLMRESSQLSLFEFNIYVHKKISNAESEDYFNWQRTFIPNTEGAKVGQMLEITDVDDLGRVTGVKAVNLTVPDSSQNATLTFKGAVEATYDGSEAVEVEIPQGGGTEPTGAEKIVEYTVDADGASAKTFSFTVEAYPKLAEYNRLRGVVKRKTNAGMPYVQVTLNTTTINYNAVAKVTQGTMGMMGFDVVRNGNYYTGKGKGPTNISLYTGWIREGTFSQSGAGNLLPLYVPELKSINIISYSTFLDEGATIEIWGWNE